VMITPFDKMPLRDIEKVSYGKVILESNPNNRWPRRRSSYPQLTEDRRKSS